MTSFLLVGLLTLVSAQGNSATPPSIIDRPAPVIVVPEQPVETPESEVVTMETAVKKMSLKQRVAQLMVVTMAGGHQPSVEDLAYLKNYTPGGAVIRKILKPSYANIYVTKLRGVEQLSGVPLWIGTNIYRLTTAEREELNEFIQLPSPLSLAAANDPDTTRALAELLAQHLSLMGFDLHLGPSLEMAPTLSSALGSVYNFGSDPKFIGETFQITREVFKENGIIAMPLGFPGGGANRSPKSAAVLLTPPNQLNDKDLAPYRMAIANDVPILHVGNTLVPTLDPTSPPASVSSAVLHDLLRVELDYKGIVIAGPMDSQDVAGVIDPADAAIRALANGADMILWNGAGSTEMRAVDQIVTAIEENNLPEALIDAALERVLNYKFDHRIESLKPRKIRPLEQKNKLARQIQSIEQKSITVVKNDGNILPLRKEKSMPMGITGTVGVDILHDGMVKHIKPISQQHITTARHLGEIQDFEIQRVTSHIRGIRTVICILGETNHPEGQMLLIRGLKEKGVQVVVVLLGYPRNLPLLAEADAIVLAYCDSSKYSETLASMADVLVGEGPVGFIRIEQDIPVTVGEARTFNIMDIIRTPPGRLPVTLSEKFSVGRAIPCDPQYAVKKVLWEFGDGKKSKDKQVVHSFATAGRYPVTLSIVSRNGESSSSTFFVQANAVQ